MCGSSPNVPKEVKTAKCIGGTVLGFAIVTLIGFALGAPGAISALGGLFAVIGGSMLCCCGPKEAGKGACTHTAAMVMCILGAICHLIGSLWLIIWYVTTMAAIEAARTQCRADCGTNDDTAWWAESCNETCDGIAAVSSAVITAAIIFMIPTIIFAVVTCAAPLSSAAPPSPVLTAAPPSPLRAASSSRSSARASAWPPRKPLSRAPARRRKRHEERAPAASRAARAPGIGWRGGQLWLPRNWIFSQ